MKQLKLINRQREVVGTITWNPPDSITLNVSDPVIAVGIQSLLNEAQEQGLPLRGGQLVERGGKKLFVENAVLVQACDERFLAAFAEAIGKASFAGQRIFGLLQEDKHHARA